MNSAILITILWSYPDAGYDWGVQISSPALAPKVALVSASSKHFFILHCQDQNKFMLLGWQRWDSGASGVAILQDLRKMRQVSFAGFPVTRGRPRQFLNYFYHGISL